VINLRASAEPGPAGSLVEQVTGARIHVDVTVPRTAVVGKMRVLTRRETAIVRAECRASLAALNLTGPVEQYREWHEELATRTVAVAVRSPRDVSQSLASLEAWEQCDEGQIGDIWQRYKDLCNEVDPIGVEALTPDELTLMEAAAKKGEASLLLSFGSCRLAAYVITTASQQPTSPTPT